MVKVCVAKTDKKKKMLRNLDSEVFSKKVENEVKQ